MDIATRGIYINLYPQATWFTEYTMITSITSVILLATAKKVVVDDGCERANPNK